MFPHLIILFLLPKDNRFWADLKRWALIESKRDCVTFEDYIVSFYTYFSYQPEFRSVFYYRVKIARLFRFLMPAMPTLYICTPDIGPGLFVQHGFATIVAAHKIGSNFWVNQQVTIGFANETDAPVIGDDVGVKAGAKVIGAVRIGDGSVVGANAVVVKDVPERCVVGGVPAVVIRRNGARIERAADGTVPVQPASA